MAFKASAKRERKKPDPVAKGTQLIPSAAVREWYERQLRMAFKSMIDDYKKELNEALQTKDVEKHFAQDASAEAVMTDVLKRLDKKWTTIFKNYAKMTATAFTEKVDTHSKSTVWHSLKVAGIEQPSKTYTRNIENTLGAAQTFNNTLITNVQRDVHEKVFSSVMLSLTSPDPAQQGTSGIENALKKVGEFSSKRIELIARDQNSKLYASLNVDRMRDNGVEKFMWIHSSAGKVPRPSHVAKDGEIFTMDDSRLWTGPKADQGPPGWAINCRCRAIPVID
jgi:SPP1 gp7 family putative phage head morphogenesis protein